MQQQSHDAWKAPWGHAHAWREWAGPTMVLRRRRVEMGEGQRDWQHVHTYCSSVKKKKLTGGRVA